VNYSSIYKKLIEFRKNNFPIGYIEKHHILPKSLGGTDDEDNVVSLSGREHYIVHLLLAKIYKGTSGFYPMINAVWMMQMRCEERGIPRIKSSRMYEWVRKEHSKEVSKKVKISSKGKNNSQYGTMWICNLELKENKKISKDDMIPEGWVVGRYLWKKVDKNKQREYKRTIKFENTKKYYTEMYNKMIFEKSTLQSFAEKYYDKSYVSLHLNFVKYVDGYSKTQGKCKFLGA